MLFCVGKLEAEIDLSSIFFFPEVGVKKLHRHYCLVQFATLFMQSLGQCLSKLKVI